MHESTVADQSTVAKCGNRGTLFCCAFCANEVYLICIRPLKEGWIAHQLFCLMQHHQALQANAPCVTVDIDALRIISLQGFECMSC